MNRAASYSNGIFDPETEGLLNRVKGHINFYRGNYIDAKTNFEEWLDFGLLSARKDVQNRAMHYIARTEIELGRQCHLSSKSDSHYREAIKLYQKIRFDDDSQFALNDFRAAQAFGVVGDEANRLSLIQRAKDILKYEPAIMLEEALLSLQEAESIKAIGSAESAVGLYKQSGYSRGLAKALYILSLSLYVEQEYIQAFEATIAALCCYLESTQTTEENELWQMVTDIKSGLIPEIGGVTQYQKHLQELYDKAVHRSNRFEILNCIDQDLTDRVNYVFGLLIGTQLKLSGK